MTTRVDKQSTNTCITGRANVKLTNIAYTGKGMINKRSVLSSMQQSLEKATQMGWVGKLSVALQADKTKIREANVWLRADVNGIPLWPDEVERQISQLEDENCQLCQAVKKIL